MSEENPPIENPHAADAPAETNASKSTMPPAVALAFVIIALLGVLIVISLRATRGSGAAGSRELPELEAEANALRDQLNRERMAMGLRPLEGSSEPVEEIAKRLKKDADTMVALASTFQEMLSEKEAELSAKNAEIIRSEQSRQALTNETARLSAELQRALISGSDSELLRRDLANLKAQRDALATELTTVRNELATKGEGVSADDFADLERQLEETKRAKDFFEAKVAELESQLNQSRLFASSENELLPAAVELFRSLRELEKHPDSDLMSSYSNLGVKLGASVLKTMTFATGSSALTPADEEALRMMVDEIPDGDLVLAIGYASETGNVDGNRVLSSDRATAVAQSFSANKRPGQLVQAVYLGQTDRFSSRIPERNQLVEIWRIRKK
jgi:outer membrane protein OmpA-like peptidoglycan-associated protein